MSMSLDGSIEVADGGGGSVRRLRAFLDAHRRPLPHTVPNEHLGVIVDMKLELVPVPVTDIDRAKAFYADRVGFALDVDVQPADGVRIVQLTPPGSACSIVLSTGLGELADMSPGTIKGLHLVVNNIEQARAELLDRGVDVADVVDVGGGVKYAWFGDPDGNSLTLQEMAWRTGDNF
jgi:predicted enzyme related to lactoylglutathione lyase